MKAHSPNHQHDQKTKALFEFLPGPVKIKDGLFMGDEIAARDIEFIISNKVTHVINTVSKQVPNLWERFGIHYLSVNWTEKQENIFDKKNNSVNMIFHFIEEAMEQGESCLIHSTFGKSRACSVTVAYLMKKYSWALSKCLEFIYSKKEHFDIRSNYMHEMKELQSRMSQIYKLTSQWTNLKNQEELTLANTLANSKTTVVKPKHQSSRPIVEKRGQNSKRVVFQQKPTIHKINSNNPKTSLNNTKQAFNKKKTPTKSILKGFPNQQEEEENQKLDQESSYPQNQASELQKLKKQRNLVNNINGNIVHVTVNNFITAEKKLETGKNSINTRPYSSDQKDREKDKRDVRSVNQKKILPYDPITFGSGSKNSYESKIGAQPQLRAGSSGKGIRQKKQETNKVPFGVVSYQRPQSAKNRTPGFHQMIGKQDLLITNGNSNSQGFQNKRYPSNPRDGLFKRK